VTENKNSNVMIKEQSNVVLVHNYIARSAGSGLVILSGSQCKMEQNIIKQCMNNGIDLNHGHIYAKKNVIVDNERCGIYGNGAIRGYF